MRPDLGRHQRRRDHLPGIGEWPAAAGSLALDHGADGDGLSVRQPDRHGGDQRIGLRRRVVLCGSLVAAAFLVEPQRTATGSPERRRLGIIDADDLCIPVSDLANHATVDQISQILGAQGAQLISLTGAIGELKAEILQNRIKASDHREREIQFWSQIEAELRNVKHDYRGMQTASEGVSYRIGKLDERIRLIEGRLNVWRGQIAVIIGLTGLAGVVLGSFATPVIHLIEKALG